MNRPSAVPTGTLRLLLALAAAVALVLGLGGSPASAHGDDGQLELVSDARNPGGGTTVDLVVRLTYVNDGDPVADATVTAVVGEANVTPLDAGKEPGLYQGAVDAPPGTAIRITSVEPVVTLDVDAPPIGAATNPSTTTTAATEGPTTTESSTTTTESSATSTTAAQGQAVLVDEDDGRSGGALVAIGVGGAAVVAAGVFAAYKLGQNKDDDETPVPGQGPGDGADPPGPVR